MEFNVEEHKPETYKQILKCLCTSRLNPVTIVNREETYYIINTPDGLTLYDDCGSIMSYNLLGNKISMNCKMFNGVIVANYLLIAIFENDS